MTITTYRAADSTTALLTALRAGGYTVETLVTGAVIVDGQHIDASAWDSAAMAWDGTADGLEDLGWDMAAEAMREVEATATTTETAWTFEGYWNAVLGSNRSAEDVVREFDLDSSDRVGLDKWLGEAEGEAAAMGGIEIPPEWAGFHGRALKDLASIDE